MLNLANINVTLQFKCVQAEKMYRLAQGAVMIILYSANNLHRCNNSHLAC